jgi:hypothetical protein
LGKARELRASCVLVAEHVKASMTRLAGMAGFAARRAIEQSLAHFPPANGIPMTLCMRPANSKLSTATAAT